MPTILTPSRLRLLVLGVSLTLFVEGAGGTEPGNDGIRRIGHNEVNPFHCMDVEIIGDRAYVANGLGAAGTETYDISDPTNITRLSALGPLAWRFRSFGSTLFSFGHEHGVTAFDVAGPTVELGTYDSPDPDLSYRGGVLDGNLLYAAALLNGIHVLDVSNLNDMTSHSTLSLGENAAWSVEKIGDRLLVANGRHGLYVVDVSNLGTPVVTATVPLFGFANEILLDDSGTVAILSLGAGGLATVDVSDPDNPAILDIAETEGSASGIGRMNDLVVVGGLTKLEMFDISDPSEIVLAGWEYTQTWAMGADIVDHESGPLIAVADWRGISTYRPESDLEPDIETEPVQVDFGAVDSTVDTVLTVCNRGTAELDVSSILTPNGFTTDPGSFVLGSGECQDVVVTATGTGTVRSSLRYISNDPDEPTYRQYVYKNNTNFLQLGDPATDFTLAGTDGEMHSLSDHIGQVVLLEFGANW